jgi:hypothetical protein
MKSAPARISIGALSIGDNMLRKSHRGLLTEPRVVDFVPICARVVTSRTDDCRNLNQDGRSDAWNAKIAGWIGLSTMALMLAAL